MMSDTQWIVDKQNGRYGNGWCDDITSFYSWLSSWLMEKYQKELIAIFFEKNDPRKRSYLFINNADRKPTCSSSNASWLYSSSSLLLPSSVIGSAEIRLLCRRPFDSARDISPGKDLIAETNNDYDDNDNEIKRREAVIEHNRSIWFQVRTKTGKTGANNEEETVEMRRKGVIWCLLRECETTLSSGGSQHSLHSLRCPGR